MRDALTHRGPDDSGLWEGDLGAIAHRRLSVIDPTPRGHQPMTSPDGRYVLAYNGELYNDHDLRAELASMGVAFTSQCDTETLLHALITWGEGAITKLRGMFAFVFLDTQARTAILARDPLGVKPLYHALINDGAARKLIVASEIPAILAYPGVPRRPDPVTLSAYLSSIRTTLGERTLFDGISTLTPGQWLTIDLTEPNRVKSTDWWSVNDRGPTQDLRPTIEDSVQRHLRTDVPMCALLSGGLDSAITTLIAKRAVGELNTFCAGARTEGFDDDFAHAARLAQTLGTNHTEVEITHDDFTHQWQAMIARLGVPLSTPNEVAIHQVCATLRAQGHVVAISGEGADELFAGYAPIMRQAAKHVAGLKDPCDPDGGLFQLRANAWISEDLKPAVLNPDWLAAADHDAHLKDHYAQTFRDLAARAQPDSPLQAHLTFQRRMNLPNLLQRLDTSSMLASVEGRTPFADIEVALCAEAMPMSRKFIDNADPQQHPQTKIALREAFASELPPEIVSRPKASFPLPFQYWMEPLTQRLIYSRFAQEVFSQQAIGLVCNQPTQCWHLAWPMINLTLWGDAWITREHSDQEAYTAACS